MSTKNVIVFGGTGFLGSHVADELSEKGFCVTIFDKAQSPYLRHDQNMIIGNILDREKVRESVRNAQIVFHFAAMADIQEARDNPVDAATYNVIGTMNISGGQ